MRDYESVVTSFDYLQLAARELQGELTAMNACIECCDRHAEGDAVALYCEAQDGRAARYTFRELQAHAAGFGNFLREQGVKPGDRVAGLMPRTVELLIAVLGTWRIGAVYQPLFTAFGPKAIEQRLGCSGARWIVTDTHNRAKLDDIADCPNIVVAGDVSINAGDHDFWGIVGRQPEDCAPVMLDASAPFLLMCTSGTTGPAKPLEVPLSAILAFKGYMRDAIDLREGDRFWNLADPGWAYGLYYAVTGPLALGHATLFYDGPFTVQSTQHVIARYAINNLAGSPTAYRLLIAAGAEFADAVRGQLRVVSSAGEPLNPQVIRWFAEELGVVIHDHYGQTEIGMVLCNHHALRHPIREGSAGYAVPGYRIVVLDKTHRELPTGQPGTLAVDRERSPLCWFGGYLGMPTKAFVGRYYLSGDIVELNDDGSISFVGRTDDVITTSGYRVGPFDVESALIEHPAVVETAVIGKPDPQRTELIKAFVVLSSQYPPSAELAEELRLHVRQRLAAHAYPREIEFVEHLPKTPSGKLQRFILRNQEIARQQVLDT
ncbi:MULTISPECIES: AMP-binding protein [Pseudomonas]|uniref:AMP-binding protein n=1 Tax=Pseudomonas TaxID=286 RepID=UPI001AEAE120|nr:MULTISPECIES: AMP-binding protein [unclassified Pseudomonas]MBP1123772.1 acetyl-CoA synthetase [Pseudomonas sp. PvP025]MDQ0397632.1 acetyl-CoA synthetase [Pseudomonas sp. PvP006]